MLLTCASIVHQYSQTFVVTPKQDVQLHGRQPHVFFEASPQQERHADELPDRSDDAERTHDVDELVTLYADESGSHERYGAPVHAGQRRRFE